MSDIVSVKIVSSFDNWLNELQSPQARYHILAKLRSLSLGIFIGDGLIGDDIYEARIDYSRGYRLYYKKQSNAITVLLGSGYRSERNQNISAIKAIIKDL